MVAGVVMAWVLVTGARVHAQEPDEGDVGEEPGPTETPPGPEGDEAPTVSPDDELRKGVRGTPVPVTPETPAQKAEREWEEKAFPKPGTVPPDEDANQPPRPSDKADLPPELRSPEAGAPSTQPTLPRVPKKPEDVRPDLPWLKQLKLGDLPITWDARVIKFLEFYKDDPRGRQLMSEWIREQGRFKPLILAALRKHGLPEDLLYVCMSESAFNPWDFSRTGASGLWQFMPAGGKVYGLKIDYWIDERNDPEKATEAAMLHWRDLYDRFGNWDLAMAAYNAGHGAVLKAIAKFNSNDFWTLVEYENGLPWASQVYVAKAQALSLVGRNREIFGYDKIAEQPVWDFDRVSVDRSVALSVIAKAVGSTEAELRWLNPELKRARTPAGVKSYSVRIPKGKKELYARTFPTLRGDWDGYDAYVMRHGERFEDVAKVYGVSEKKLRELNGVDSVAEVRGGTTIVVPHVDEATRVKNRAEADLDLYQSDIAPGDPGDPLIVAVPDKDKQVAGRRRVFYRVVAGDEPAEIAEALQVRTADLRAWNAIAEEAELQPRMVLVAFVKPDYDADTRHVALLDDSRLMVVSAGSDEHLDLVEGRKGRKRVKVVAKKGDTMESIGKPHFLSKYDMARINKRSYSKELEPGEELIVYEIVDKAKARKAGIFDKKKSSAPKARQGRGKPRGK